MLSYRHAFHVGNFADVFKHIVLIHVLDALKKKDKPFFVLDCHAGKGKYDLRNARTKLKEEWRQGVALLWEQKKFPHGVQPYMDILHALNPKATRTGGMLIHYPGSPEILHRLLRPGDRLLLTELQDEELASLQKQYSENRKIQIRKQDAYQALNASVPPPEKRGLVIIDPSFERKTERQDIVTVLKKAWKKWPTGVYMIWHPLQGRSQTEQFYRQMRDSGITRILKAELSILPDDVDKRLNGSGVLLINPPWPMEESLREILPWLHNVLSPDGRGGWQVDWLVSE